LDELQTKLFNPDIEERESEALNVEYELLMNEIELTEEYQQEQKKIDKKWTEDHHPVNMKAYLNFQDEMNSWPPMKKTAQMKRHPEFRLLDYSSPVEAQARDRTDFSQLRTDNLTLDQARAIYVSVTQVENPKQSDKNREDFITRLKEKIEQGEKPVSPPPIKKCTLSLRKPKQTQPGGGGNFLDELLKKRKPSYDVPMAQGVQALVDQQLERAKKEKAAKEREEKIKALEMQKAQVPITMKAHSMTRPLDSFIMLQNVDGSFVLDVAFQNATGLTADVLISGLPQSISSLSLDQELLKILWVTAIALAYFEDKYLSFQNEWMLIGRKSEKFLLKNLISFGPNVHNDLMQQAKSFLKLCMGK